MPKIYPTETGKTTGTEKEETPQQGFKKTFGVYDQPFRSSRAMIIAFIIVAVVFLAVVIMLVQR